MISGETLTVSRGGTDKYGNPNKADHGTVTGVFAWGTGAGTARFGGSGIARGRSNSNSLTAELYVERGTDLKPRDRITRANGEQYTVVGHGSWDQVDPLTGYDFGYMVFQVEAVNG